MPDVPMTPARLDEISALADAATPGPWRALLSYSKTKGHLTMAHFIRPPKPGSNVEDIKAWKLDNVCDLMFVAAARTAVDELLAEVRRARAAEAEARVDAERYREDHAEACARIVAMHEAAVGNTDGPVLGVVEDVAAVRAEVEKLRAENAELAKERDTWRARVEFWCDDEGCAVPCTPGCPRAEAEREA